MAMKKSIGRTLAHVDVAANTSVRIHEDFFNSHRSYQQWPKVLREAETGHGPVAPRAFTSNVSAFEVLL